MEGQMLSRPFENGRATNLPSLNWYWRIDNANLPRFR